MSDCTCPGIQGEIDLGCLVHPDRGVHHRRLSNAVNFTDGLDGLAGLIAATAFAAYGGIALMQEQIYLARFCFTLVGALVWLFVVQRASRRNCSWAIPVRWPWVPRWLWSP